MSACMRMPSHQWVVDKSTVAQAHLDAVKVLMEMGLSLKQNKGVGQAHWTPRSSINYVTWQIPKK